MTRVAGSEAALARFGQAAQTLSHLAVAGHYPHPAPDYLLPLTHPADANMWSVGMLFKYGPTGDTWDPTVLSDVSAAMLDWRAGQPAMRPGYVAGSSYTAGQDTLDNGSWYHAIGLTPGSMSSTAATDPGRRP